MFFDRRYVYGRRREGNCHTGQYICQTGLSCENSVHGKRQKAGGVAAVVEGHVMNSTGKLRLFISEEKGDAFRYERAGSFDASFRC